MSLSYSKSLNHGKAQLTEISEEASAEKMHVADTEKEVSKYTSTFTLTKVDKNVKPFEITHPAKAKWSPCKCHQLMTQCHQLMTFSLK